MIKNPYTKHPYKTFEQQLEEIRKKDILIDNIDVAHEALRSFSYYTIINGYKDLFLDLSRTTSSQEKCLPGTTFSMLYTIHWMDLTLSGILFKYTLAIEKKLKTQVSNLVGRKFSIQENNYLNKRNYGTAKHNRGKLSELIKQIDLAKNYDPSAKHYFESKESNVPPWIAAKAISFGNIMNWYSILKEYDKKEVILAHISESEKLGLQEMMKFFDNVIDQVYQYRNITAHGNRTIGLKLPKDIKENHLKKLGIQHFFVEGSVFHNNDLCSLIFCMALLINDRFVLANMIVELDIFLERYNQPEFIFLEKNVYSLFNIPPDMIEKLNALYDLKFNK